MNSSIFSSFFSVLSIISLKVKGDKPLPKELAELRKADISQPRNPLIAKMFRVIKLAETAGYGFDKIFKGWSTYVDDEPTCVNKLDYVVLNMPTQKTKKLVEGLVESQKKILELTKENPFVSKAFMSEKIGISTTAVDKNIEML